MIKKHKNIIFLTNGNYIMDTSTLSFDWEYDKDIPDSHQLKPLRWPHSIFFLESLKTPPLLPSYLVVKLTPEQALRLIYLF